MRRTNIYLDERQAETLDELARAQGLSRAALIRRIVDREIQSVGTDPEADLAAIEASFGASRDADPLRRGIDERSRHLDSVRGI